MTEEPMTEESMPVCIVVCVQDGLEFPRCKHFINIKSGKYIDIWCTKLHLHPFSVISCFSKCCFEERPIKRRNMFS